jgi:transposase
MRDTDLYQRILGIEAPWVVSEVDLDTPNKQVRVVLRNEQPELPCPTCGELRPRYDSRHRRWRHLDTCQFQTFIEAEVPRVKCPEHGVLQVRVSWGEPGSRFTALYEALVIDWLKEAGSIAAVARLLGLSWDEVDGIMARAVARGLARRAPKLPRRLGVDETSFQRRHEYVTVLVDQEQGTVVHVGDGRGRNVLDEFFQSFSDRERAEVEFVAMDMWEGYIRPVVEHIPGGEEKIAFDKFHVAKHLGDAVDKVRRQENKALLAQGIETLKGSKYLWLTNPNSLDEARWDRFQPLRFGTLKTARAWALKEVAMELWDYRSRGWARRAWMRWYAWAIRSRLEPMRKVARTIKNRLEGIVTAVVLGVTNARAEGLNSAIQKIKFTARGFRNRDRFRNAIYFHLGGLDLYPATLAA